MNGGGLKQMAYSLIHNLSADGLRWLIANNDHASIVLRGGDSTGGTYPSSRPSPDRRARKGATPPVSKPRRH
ncbi:MAG: hypothetical protein ABI852_10560 [Gemmatimonadaceae bacterium]